MPDGVNHARAENAILPTEGEGQLAARQDARAAGPRSSPSGWITAAHVLLVVGLGLGLRVYRIGQQPLWLDEASSLLFARAPLAHLWSWTVLVDPGNPPLYYSLLHGWLVFGQSEAILRFLSAILGTAAIPIVYGIGRTIRDHRLGILAAFLFAISPFQVWYSQEARGYTLLTLGATTAMLGVAYLLRFPERAGNPPLSGLRSRLAPRGRSEAEADRRGAGWAWLAYVAGAAVALLAHDTAIFLVIGANVLMLGWWWVRRGRYQGFVRNWLLAQLALLLLWATWLPAFVKQVINGGAYAWIPAPTIGRVTVQTIVFYSGPLRITARAVDALVILALGGLGLWSWRRERRWIAFVLVFSLAALLGELIVSVWRPIFLPKTLIWAAVPVHVAVAAGLLRLRPRAASALALVAVVALSAVGLDAYYYHRDREAWDQVAAYVDRGLEHGDAIVFSEDFLRIPFDYYYDPPSSYSVPEIGLTGTSEDPQLVLRETTTRGRVWLIVSHARSGAEAVLTSLAGAGRLTRVAQFKGVDVYLYDMAG